MWQMFSMQRGPAEKKPNNRDDKMKRDNGRSFGNGKEILIAPLAFRQDANRPTSKGYSLEDERNSKYRKNK